MDSIEPVTASNDMNQYVGVQNPKPRIPSPFLALYKDNYQPGLLRKVLAEVVATYLLVFVTCGAGAISASDPRRISQLGASIAGGMIVTVMIYSVGHISGAHMNPAVTLGFASFLHFPWKQVNDRMTDNYYPNVFIRIIIHLFLVFLMRVPFFIIAQITGATSAAFTLRELLEPIKRIGTTTPSGTDAQALVMEIVVTFTMMFVTSAVATDAKAVGELAGLAVGSSVCITSIVAGPVSGGSMNPARTLGPALASAEYKGLWVYFVGPVIGTLSGSCFYKIIQLSERKPIVSPSLSLKLRRMVSGDFGQVDTKEPVSSAV